jgi:hypothetical protein
MTKKFEVSLADRLKQRNAAHNEMRMPALGYKKYRVHDILKDDPELRSYGYNTYNNNLGGQSPGTINVVIAGQNSGKSLMWNYCMIDALYPYMYSFANLLTDSTVQWLKPKQVTALILKGHHVVEL